MAGSKASWCSLALLVLMGFGCTIAVEGNLSPNFYHGTCSSALSSIRAEVRKAIAVDRRMAASLIRLHFHDCFVQGCDASILLDRSSAFESEKDALPNLDSVRGYEVVDRVKSRLEEKCPGVVSCADILAVAAKDASEIVGGPKWKVKLGRRDTTTPSKSLANSDLPKFTDSLDALISAFSKKGLSVRDLVALSGAHTIGQAACATFRDRIYSNDTASIDANFASNLRRRCPSASGNGDRNLAPLDPVTPNHFDKNYFENLKQKKGLLTSDQELFSGGQTDDIVREYAKKKKSFFDDFAVAMIRMGDIAPLTGSAGEVRINCRIVN